MNSLRHPLPRPVRPHGSVAVPFALILPVVLGIMGMAIDLSIIYLRNTEMQQLADSTAMAAARRLDGTVAGVNAAIADAAAMAQRNTYGGEYSGAKNAFDTSTSSWTSGALFLSKAPSGQDWVPAESVTDAAAAADMMYVKVDTRVLSGLAANPGRVETTLMRFLGAADSFTMAPVAVAGKTGMHVTPLAICALNNLKFTPRASSAGNELVEFGYRRGVTYDLMKISSVSNVPMRFVVNPIDDRNVASPDPAHYSKKFIKPFFCSGSIAYSTLRSNATAYVASIDTLGVDIHDWLNSRFNDYTGSGDACAKRDGAPPDTNVREFLANVAWVPNKGPSATTYWDGAHLATKADSTTLPPQTEVKDYGPVWVNAKPVKFVSAVAGGGTSPVAFKLSDIPSLYPINAGPAWSVTNLSLYYKDPPYKLDAPVAPSSGIAVQARRTINVPLLDCSTIGTTATVLGIGQFLLTAKATTGAVYGEFAGLVNENTLVSNVRRFQ